MHRYVLGMFPYPSGTAHMGHVRVYTITDTVARHARLHGHAVLHPMGWDAFGLPAENAAIRQGVDPAAWTAANVDTLRDTFRRMRWSFDWDREIDTSSPDYYRWTQWLFLRLVERGLAVRAPGWVNHCPRCATVLADEQATAGVCWRCDGPVERRRIPGWTLRITAYAQRLWDGLDALQGWDPRAVAVQRHWIGRTEGARATVHTERGPIELFVARDAIEPVRAVFVAPEHPIAWASPDPALRAAAAEAVRRTEIDRVREPARLRRPTGITSVEGLPVWVDDSVVPGMGVEAAPWFGGDPDVDARIGDGSVALVTEPAVAFRLRDWSVGRQRRWGCPIPIWCCPSCGDVPADALPVRLDAPTTGPCPRCGREVVREVDTLDTFVDSAWYPFRFTDPHREDVPFGREQADRWMPVDTYVGGLDHAAQHMLYVRFIAKVLFDEGMIGFDEPVAHFVCNGMVLNPQGRRMSKSAGTGVDPATLLRDHPPDAIRLAVLADAPVERDRVWDTDAVSAKERFLTRWGARIDAFLDAWPGEVHADRPWPDPVAEARVRDRIAALGGDLETLALHNAVARVHQLEAALDGVLDAAADAPDAARSLVHDVLAAVSPLIPDFVGDRWPASWGEPRWPSAQATDRVEIVVQVDGRTVGRIPADRVEVVTDDPRVARRLQGRTVLRTVHVPGRLVNLVTR
ncbi:MAG: class I tRNA ligase family protein [Myxococcales bacterium]|nr:class I tRNA ligase family protein [Myxococcales bacterium]